MQRAILTPHHRRSMRRPWTLGRWIAAGALEQCPVEDQLYASAVLNGLVGDDGDRQCWATIRSGLEGRRLAPSTINQHLSAIRALADECGESGLLDQPTAAAIGRVKGVPVCGMRAGNWLNRDQAERLLLAPPNTLMGLRDRAILGLLIGCGLRRDELVNLTFEHLQQGEGRWVIVDIVGKGRRVRTVPVPGWAKALVDVWAFGAGLSSGLVLRRFRKGGFLVYEASEDGDVKVSRGCRRTPSPTSCRCICVPLAGS